VNVGEDVNVAELLEAYDAVVLVSKILQFNSSYLLMGFRLTETLWPGRLQFEQSRPMVSWPAGHCVVFMGN